MKLDDREWKPIPIVQLFDRFEPGKGKGLNHLEQTDCGIPYIGATNRNNGVLCFVKYDDASQKMIQSGNCIGFIKNGDGAAGYAIYKKESFISTNDVIYGYAGWINAYTGLFFVASQDMIKRKYSHGYKRNAHHLKGDRVMLPVNDNGRPDFHFMEGYIRDLMEAKRKQYHQYIEKIIKRLPPPNRHEIYAPKWKAFSIVDIFSINATKSGIDKIKLSLDLSPNTYPYITRTNKNNGWDMLISRQNCPPDMGNSISIGLDTQTVFYQPIAFYTGQNIQVCTSPKLNKYVALFIIPALKKQMKKFNWGGNGATLSRLKALKIVLPVNSRNEPDYAFMEQYMRLEEQKHLLRYKTYIQKRLTR